MSLFSFGANTNTSRGAFGGAGAGSSGSGGMFGGGGSGGAFGASTSTSTSSNPLGGSSTTTGGAFGSGAGAGAAQQQPQQVITLSGPPASREAQWLMCIPAVLASGAEGKSFEVCNYLYSRSLFYANLNMNANRKSVTAITSNHTRKMAVRRHLYQKHLRRRRRDKLKVFHHYLSRNQLKSRSLDWRSCQSGRCLCLFMFQVRVRVQVRRW